MYNCGNTGVEWLPKLELAQKVSPVKENSPAAPATFNHESGTLTTELSSLLVHL